MASKVLTPNRMYGVICPIHPEFEGLRRKSPRICVQCSEDKVNEYRKTARGLAAANARNRAIYHKDPSKALARYIARKSAKEQRVPSWADHGKIKEIYKQANELGLVVDHIIPLRGELVSGLHAHNNLQLLTQEENDKKGNKYEL